MVSGFDCPECGEERKGGTFVLGHHYCPKCDIRFDDSSEKVGDGRV
jgi:hypothetical protein